MRWLVALMMLTTLGASSATAQGALTRPAAKWLWPYIEKLLAASKKPTIKPATVTPSTPRQATATAPSKQLEAWRLRSQIKTSPLAARSPSAPLAPASEASSFSSSFKKSAGEETGKLAVRGTSLAALFAAQDKYCEKERNQKKCNEIKRKIAEAARLGGQSEK